MCCAKTKETASGERSEKKKKEEEREEGTGHEGDARESVGGRGEEERRAGGQQRQLVDAFSGGNDTAAHDACGLWWRRMLHKDTDEPSK